MCTSVAPVFLHSSAALRAPSVLTETAISSDGLKVTSPAQLITQASLPVSFATCSAERPSSGSVTSPASGTHFSRTRSCESPRNGGEVTTLWKKRSSAVPPARGRTST